MLPKWLYVVKKKLGHFLHPMLYDPKERRADCKCKEMLKKLQNCCTLKG